MWDADCPVAFMGLVLVVDALAATNWLLLNVHQCVRGCFFRLIVAVTVVLCMAGAAARGLRAAEVWQYDVTER